MNPIRSFLLLALALAAPVHAAETRVDLRGYAYDLKSGAFLYTEVHQQRVDGDRWLGGTIDYYAGDGSKLGSKALDFSQDPHIPRYRLELQARGGYVEGIGAVSANSVELYREGKDASSPGRKKVKRKGPMAADSGFHPFIRDNFAELLSGRTVQFTFAAAGQLDTFRFRARRIEDSSFEGKPAVRFLVEPDSLLRLVADPLEITYDPAQRQLLEYRGLSNIHDPVTGEPYNVRIIFPSKPPADAPPLPDP